MNRRACLHVCAAPVYVHIYEASCHLETCESEIRCVCVTRRLVATGGGKQADLYSFDHPGGSGLAAGGSRKSMASKWRRKISIPGSETCAAGYVNIQVQISVVVIIYYRLSSFTSASGTIPCISALLM